MGMIKTIVSTFNPQNRVQTNGNYLVLLYSEAVTNQTINYLHDTRLGQLLWVQRMNIGVIA